VLVWGFLYTYLYDSKSSMASTGGILLGAVLLWDVLFRGQLGFSFTFLEEIWSPQPRQPDDEPAATGPNSRHR